VHRSHNALRLCTVLYSTRALFAISETTPPIGKNKGELEARGLQVAPRHDATSSASSAAKLNSDVYQRSANASCLLACRFLGFLKPIEPLLDVRVQSSVAGHERDH
jgi:hypothetical protein